MRAFGPFPAETVVDYRELGERRMFLISGPTGAGKTTTLDAMMFALFGETSGRDRRASQMRSQSASPGLLTEVLLDFALGGESYRVRRVPEQDRPNRRGPGRVSHRPEAVLWRRTGRSDDREDGEVLAARWERVDEKVEELLGFSADQFRQVVLLPQGQFRRFLSASSVEREEILEALFGTELYRRVEEALRQEAEKLRGQAEDLRLEEETTLRNAAASGSAELEGRKAAALDRARERMEAVGRLRGREEELGRDLAAAEEVARKLAARDAARRKRDEARPALEKARVAREAAERAHSEEAARGEERRRAEDEARSLEERARKLLDLPALRAEQEAASGDAAALEARLADQRGRADRLESSWSRGQAAVLAGRLAPGRPCDVCGSPDHPSPARPEPAAPREAEVLAARSALRALEDRRPSAHSRAAEAEERLRALGEDARADLGALRCALEAARGRAAALAAALEAARGALGAAREAFARADQAASDAGRDALLAERAAEGLEPRPLAPMAEELARVRAEMEQAIGEETTARNEAERTARTLEQLEALRARLEAVEREYAVMGRVADAAGGRNPQRITFQRFVLRSFLEEVLGAATARLAGMSRGRYALRVARSAGDGRSSGGLELEVDDAWTGAPRPVATLSGGEGFLASLALALGLADVVQSRAGGIRLDTVFVDEGFGTLDEEALERAIATLTDLRREGRLVGIISHVPELRERIDARLEITADRESSAARFVLA
jgi:exonuclease SbcC